jgi:hypothetical protein
MSANGNLEGTSTVRPTSDSKFRNVTSDLEINCYRSFYVAILGIRTLIVVILSIFILSGIFVHDMMEEPLGMAKQESKIVSNLEHHRDRDPSTSIQKESRLLPMRRIVATTIVASFVYLTIKTVIGWLSMLTVKKKYLHLSLLLECISLFLCGYLLDPLSSVVAAVIVVIQGLCILSLVKIIKITESSTSL